MAMTSPPSSSPKAVVLDASVVVAIVTKELSALSAVSEIAMHTSRGAAFHAPGVIVSEVLYVLCRKLESSALTASSHAQSIQDFQDILNGMTKTPFDEFTLMVRAEEIRRGYSCRQSADGLYIALAEQLALAVSTVLLTCDHGLSAQAAHHTPAIVVRVF